MGARKTTSERPFSVMAGLDPAIQGHEPSVWRINAETIVARGGHVFAFPLEDASARKHVVERG
jgi:hypothetical protein